MPPKAANMMMKKKSTDIIGRRRDYMLSPLLSLIPSNLCTQIQKSILMIVISQVLQKELDPENCDEFNVFVKSHKRKRGLGDYPHEDTKDVCEKVIERVEELKIQLQNVDPATKAHRLKLSAVLDEVAGKHHGGYERGYGAGYKGRTMDEGCEVMDGEGENILDRISWEETKHWERLDERRTRLDN
ncbi:uncharacterized protein A4U43_C05F15290 [Asparagus officinalis]|uniref:Uncharacterized protein n=1 Tax=Asparagus officinalis TaxID=4686 RepID=A0A5P1EVH8_ASPOF|nr:uncharacterized protein A4U43_C05F15290 [Asparagus officinalis]